MISTGMQGTPFQCEFAEYGEEDAGEHVTLGDATPDPVPGARRTSAGLVAGTPASLRAKYAFTLALILAGPLA